jgi:hypothetical protein
MGEMPWYVFADRAAVEAGDGPQVRTSVTVRFKPHVHQRLTRLSGIATEQAGKRVSFNCLLTGIIEQALDEIEQTIQIVDMPQANRDGATYVPPRGRRLFRRRPRQFPPQVA